MSTRKILITGGDGYMGLRIAVKYLERTGDPILLWVRAASEDEFHAKQERLKPQLCEYGGRVSYAYGDLADENPFARVDPSEIKAVIHSAAVTRFNVDEATARKLNTEGTQKLLRFARGCRSLEAMGLLSTVYASGMSAGLIEEEALDGTRGFANFYESSKWMAEEALRNEADGLPWRVFRIATIIADDRDGRVTQYNSFHNTLKLIFYGLLSLIPGDQHTPLYFVTGEFAAEAVYALMRRPEERVVYHVSHSAEEALTLGELIEIAFDAFLRDKDFERRRVLKPLYSDAESFELLAEAVGGFGGGIVNQAMASVAPFARQLFINKRVSNRRLMAALGDYRAPDTRSLIRNTCDYLVRTKWGRHAEARD